MTIDWGSTSLPFSENPSFEDTEEIQYLHTDWIALFLPDFSFQSGRYSTFNF